MQAITNYPQTIRSLRLQILKTEQQERRLAETLASIDSEIDRAIAFNGDLKNSEQRKAEKLRLQQENEIRCQTVKRLENLADRKTELEIDLEYYRGEFSLLKLLDRKAIAQREPALPSL